MKKTTLLLILLANCTVLQAQYQDRNWIFGRPTTGSTNATLYFGSQPMASNPVISLPSGQPFNIANTNGNEQWAVVNNPFTGALVFYTDGKKVFDDQHNLITNFDLGANVSCSQPVAIAPVPRSELKSSHNQYYIFSNGTGSFLTSYDIGTITYRMYHVPTQTFGPAQPLPGIYGTSEVSEGMKIIPSDTNPDILWLVVSMFPNPGFTQKYVVYKIDKTVISYHNEFDFGPQKAILPGGASPIVFITYSKANTPTGITNIGFALQYNPAVFTVQFDNINGQFLTNTVRSCNTGYTGTLPSIYNLEYSPNGRFIYYSVYRTNTNENRLFQVDLNDAVLTPTQVKAFNFAYAGGLRLAPDSLIYHIYDDGYSSQMVKLGRILTPDVKFIPGLTNINQFYQESFQTYPGVFGIGLCEFLVMPVTNPTPPIHVETQLLKNQTHQYKVYPNPAREYTIVSDTENHEDNAQISLFDHQGRLIFTDISSMKGEHLIKTDNLSPGIYHLRIENASKLQSIKLIVQP
jgi:large repetitive protein